jgi:hypothetical protein
LRLKSTSVGGFENNPNQLIILTVEGQ